MTQIKNGALNAGLYFDGKAVENQEILLPELEDQVWASMESAWC